MKKRKIVSFCLTDGNIPEGHHCTLLFKPRGEIRDWFIQRLGEPVRYDVIAQIKNNCVACDVLVLKNPDLYMGTSRPHVTTWVAEGSKPVQSNDLINEEFAEGGDHNFLTELFGEDLDFGNGEKTGFISALYYSADGKQYSTNPSDWE